MPEDLENFPCENYEVKDSCFGKLQNNEMLARIAIRDVKSVSAGRITGTALTVGQFRKKGGWSFTRYDHADMKHAMKRHVGYNGSDGKYCYANIKTSDIRSLRDKEGWPVCVIANPQEGYPEHALAHSKHRSFSSPQVKRFRDDLLKKFGKVNNNLFFLRLGISLAFWILLLMLMFLGVFF